jgi:hypothetical protein
VLVEAADQVEEQLAAGLRERQVAELVVRPLPLRYAKTAPMRTSRSFRGAARSGTRTEERLLLGGILDR